MSKEEAIKLFTKEQVLLGTEENKKELDHLISVICMSVAKIIAKKRSSASKLSKFLPSHHKHSTSEKNLVPAVSFILKPYALQETKNPDTIKLLIRIQRKFLESVARSKNNDPAFMALILKLEDLTISNEEREAAEATVMEAVLQYGVWIGHGDLLTVKMVMEAKMLMSGSATAFGRLDFLCGPFRLQLLHMKMKKVSQDYSQEMPLEINFDDVLCLAWCAALARIQVSNKSKEIKKNDSSFEKHDQFIGAVQESYLLNMFDNYNDIHPELLENVSNYEGVIAYIRGMLEYFDAQIYYDPTRVMTRQDNEDDLFIYCRVRKKIK